jgi:hypothetical protein
MSIATAVLRYAERLRFKQLFLLTSTLLVVDLLVPDLIPFVDELLLGLLTLLFAAWRKPAEQPLELPSETASAESGSSREDERKNDG